MNNSFYLVLSQPLSMKYPGIHKKSFGLLLLVSLCSSIDSDPLLAMDNDEAATESTRLRKTVTYVKPSWYQSVEIQPMPKNYKQQSYYSTGDTRPYGGTEIPGFKGEGRYEGFWDMQQHYTLCCCWSRIQRSSDDLVAFESDKHKIMSRGDAISIMNAENAELIQKNEEIYYRNKEAYEIYKEKKCREDTVEQKRQEELYQSQSPKLNRYEATYDGGRYFHNSDPWHISIDEGMLRTKGVCNRIIKELKEAGAALERREKAKQVEYNKPANQLKRQEEALENHRKALEANTREHIRLREELAKGKK